MKIYGRQSRLGTGDAQSDIFANVAILFILLFVVAIVLAGGQFSKFREAKAAHEQALADLRAEEEAKKAAEAQAEESDKAASAAKRREKDAKARAATAQAAAERVLGTKLSYEDMDDIANLPAIKERLRRAEAMNRDLAQEISRLAADLTASQADTRAAQAAADSAERREQQTQAKLDACKAKSGGDQDGNLVNSGYRLWIDGSRGTAIITDAEQADPRYWNQRFTCTPLTARLPAGSGGAYRDAGTIGR